MRLPRMRFTLRSVMVAVAVSALACWAFARYERWSEYDSGWWEAEREIWRGALSIYENSGLLGLDDIDRRTGLPLNHVGFVEDVHSPMGQEKAEWVKGHNDHIAQFIRSHGLPRYSLKRWEKELFNLATYFDEQSRIETPKRLCAGGPGFVSPDGRNLVRAVAGRRSDGRWPDSLDLVISTGDVVLGVPYVRFGKGDSDFLWGPAGSRFVVVRSRSAGKEHYVACDLRTGRNLRQEGWISGKHKDPNEPYELCCDQLFWSCSGNSSTGRIRFSIFHTFGRRTPVALAVNGSHVHHRRWPTERLARDGAEIWLSSFEQEGNEGTRRGRCMRRTRR